MAPRKRIIDGTTSKGKIKAITGGATSKPTNSQPFVEGIASISPQESSSVLTPLTSKKTSSFKYFTR